MEQELALTKPQSLKLYEPRLFGDQPPKRMTPNEWFVQRYKSAYDKFGSPFLELHDPYLNEVHVISMNQDFFAAVLGGRHDLGHHVIYLENEMQWYFKDSDQIYKPTSPEKLANLYRALMVKCAQDMPPNVHRLNLFHEWRSDKTAKTVVQRAKSVLAADSSFFSSTSPHQRIKGPELHQRIAQVFVEQLERDPSQILTIKLAYELFSQHLKQKDMPVLKRSEVKVMLAELIREQYGLGLRNDLIDVENQRQQCGWKGLRSLATYSTS